MEGLGGSGIMENKRLIWHIKNSLLNFDGRRKENRSKDDEAAARFNQEHHLAIIPPLSSHFFS